MRNMEVEKRVLNDSFINVHSLQLQLDEIRLNLSHACSLFQRCSVKLRYSRNYQHVSSIHGCLSFLTCRQAVTYKNLRADCYTQNSVTHSNYFSDILLVDT